MIIQGSVVCSGGGGCWRQISIPPFTVVLPGTETREKREKRQMGEKTKPGIHISTTNTHLSLQGILLPPQHGHFPSCLAERFGLLPDRLEELVLNLAQFLHIGCQ